MTLYDFIDYLIIDFRNIFVYYMGMEKEYWCSKFYGSKLNTVLLLVLIILMIFALRIMLKDKANYLPFLN